MYLIFSMFRKDFEQYFIDHHELHPLNINCMDRHLMYFCFCTQVATRTALAHSALKALKERKENVRPPTLAESKNVPSSQDIPIKLKVASVEISPLKGPLASQLRLGVDKIKPPQKQLPSVLSSPPQPLSPSIVDEPQWFDGEPFDDGTLELPESRRSVG